MESITIEDGTFAEGTTYEFSELRSLSLINGGILYNKQYNEEVLPPYPKLVRLQIVSVNDSARTADVFTPFVLAYGSTLEILHATFDGDVTNMQPFLPQASGSLTWCRRLRYLLIYAPHFFCQRGAEIFSNARPGILQAVVSILPPSEATGEVQSSARHSPRY